MSNNVAFTAAPRVAALLACLSLAASAGSVAAAELLPGEVPLTWDRNDILNRPLPTIGDVVAAAQSPDVQPLVGFRLYGDKTNHYAPLWSRDGRSLCCLRSDLNLQSCKLLVFLQLDQSQPRELYPEGFTYDHMAAWARDPRPSLLFASNNEEGREENLHRLDVDRERQTVRTFKLTTGKGAKTLPSFHHHGNTVEVAYRNEARVMQAKYDLGAEAQWSARPLGDGQEATWSRDGRFLAVIRDQPEGHALFARDPKTQRELPLLVEPDRLIRNPSWSPDGRLIACFSRPREQLAWELWICPVMQNSQPRKVAPAVRVDEDFRNIGPAWSADGARVWHLPGEGEQGYYPLAWVSRDGSRRGLIQYQRGLTTALDLAAGPTPEHPALAFVAVEKLAVDVFVLLLNRP